jgi:2-(1,2-epoxy-1,2-dihydrophenyl)acetyl-CoA isomerase
VADVDVTREGSVLTITLNRPDVLNALNASVHAGIHGGLSEARNPAVRAVVVTGAGRGFCVGQDLQEFRSGAGDVAATLRQNYHRNVLAIRRLEKPVIAAVNGPAAGAGMSLALACDVRIAADAAAFVPAFINIGLVPDSGGTYFVRRILGTARAFEWLTTGRRLTAAEALQWGLVSEVVPLDELPARAREVAELFAAMPTRAVWHTKRLLDAAEDNTLAEQLELEARTQSEQTRTRDFFEGTTAFLEKREPSFTGEPLGRPHPVSIETHDDLVRWRLTVFFRHVLVIPHLLLLWSWGLVAVPVAIVNWVITLARGRTPDGLHEWNARLVRYGVHVTAYGNLVADPFPRFRGWYGTYPIDLHIAPPLDQQRWRTLLRAVLAIPFYVFASALGVALAVTATIGWFVALAVGRYPRGFRDLSVYVLRYQAQMYAFLLLLTDAWPSLQGSDVPPPYARPRPQVTQASS